MSILEKIIDIGLNKMVNQTDHMIQKRADVVYPEDMMAWEEIKHIAQSNMSVYNKLPAMNAVAKRMCWL